MSIFIGHLSQIHPCFLPAWTQRQPGLRRLSQRISAHLPVVDAYSALLHCQRNDLGAKHVDIRKTNINAAEYTEEAPSARDGATGRTLDLSGAHLGVRIEEADAGGTSSYHHFHTAEEEHVLVLKGTGTLHLGDEHIDLAEGDHVWFPAGEETPHHLENTSTEPFRYLVFGERKQDDVVFYPESSVVLVKSAKGFQLYNYEKRQADT